MNKILTSRSNRFVSFGLMAALAAAVLMAPVAANATPYVITFTQQGSNVLANGSGAFDLDGLTYAWSESLPTFGGQAGVTPVTGRVQMGLIQGTEDTYTPSIPFSGPANFGSGFCGGVCGSSTTTGNLVIVLPRAISATPSWLDVAGGYTSGSLLSNSATWDNTSFASLGLTPGTYTWTWGTGADQGFTIDILAPSINTPEPTALGMFGFGVLLIGAFTGLRRRLV